MIKFEAMKLLSDFDGVWTNQDDEADYVRAFIVHELSRITEKDEQEIIGMAAEFRRQMDMSPNLYGWRYNGEIAAFFGEDPFGDNNALFDYIEQEAKKKISFTTKTQTGREIMNDPRKIRERILDAGFESLDMFANHCFTEATGKFKEGGKLKPHEHAKKTIEELVNAGIELVIASNSGTGKIEYVLDKMGYKSKMDSPDGHRGNDNIRARGNATKFGIENDYELLPRYLEVSEKYKIPLRRKSYHELLLEEVPDYVLGDVFSLDIALPLYLIRNDENFRNIKVILKVQPYTPEWVREILARAEFRNLAFMVDDIREVVSLIGNF
jgi:FMN phosphatase YigB (HAD superfamily)